MKPRAHCTSRIVCWVLLLVGATPASAQQPQSRHLAAVSAAEAAPGRSELVRAPFVIDQLRYPRVRAARQSAGPRIRTLFDQRGLRHPAAEVYLRAFKRERALELWVRPQGDTRFHLLKTYEICALAGVPGPKQRQGDEQVPEGFYRIDLFNPVSAYHLSLRVDYPNRRDRIVNRGRRTGGDIFIHGGCKSIGCIAVTDAGIEEIYWIAVEARAIGQRNIPVHIFPARPGSEYMRRLTDYHARQPDLLEFWRSLRPGYDYFERNRRLPVVAVDARGRYQVQGGEG